MKKTVLLINILVTAFSLSAQTVSIGTNASPRAALELHGVVGTTSAIFGADGRGMSVMRNTAGVGFNTYHNGNYKFIKTGYAAQLSFDHVNGLYGIDMLGTGSEGTNSPGIHRVLTANSLGNVNLGNGLSASGTLDVHRIANAEVTACLFGTTHQSAFNGGIAEHTYIRAGKDNGIVFINDIPGAKTFLSGPVGIRTSTPEWPLEIRQSGSKGIILVEPDNFNNWALHTAYTTVVEGWLELTFNGTMRGYFQGGDGVYQTVSDSRTKENIKLLPGVLNKVMQLNPVKYEMIHNNPEHQLSVGFIAQDVKRVFPELVKVSRDTLHGYKGIADLHLLHYTGFGTIAIKAIQEQQAILRQQEQQIRELELEFEMLERVVSDQPPVE